MPTLEDYRALAQAYQELQARFEQQARELAELRRELEIKNEALQRQSADLKSLEAELAWTKAALQQATEQADKAAESSGENWQERYLRLQAELDNLRKRLEQRSAAETREARQRILRDMLPLADHLDLALAHAPEHAEGTGKEFIRNIEAVRQAFLETLKRYGVERIQAEGQPFDPHIHEAVGEVDDPNVPAGHVARVIQAGYQENGQLLRPARVLVSR
ncbi:nucleotide exchange factor GrpE [Litorilinea aerophila]|uniref:nucleotide exchange factor GrpE n=1 Tax=Litorilinea aerophila TaxID=1204385 RepID=UPI001477710E|nr:nucleotide exchange factor GrpE [Litorilinea aerophila]MCC9076818.1 nucleotide exchange factor GrpE [Litorilinea aerophila]GIV76598.1 MAG: protein GrpE [Litorilinea sp.]